MKAWFKRKFGAIKNMRFRLWRRRQLSSVEQRMLRIPTRLEDEKIRLRETEAGIDSQRRFFEEKIDLQLQRQGEVLAPAQAKALCGFIRKIAGLEAKRHDAIADSKDKSLAWVRQLQLAENDFVVRGKNSLKKLARNRAEKKAIARLLKMDASRAPEESLDSYDSRRRAREYGEIFNDLGRLLGEVEELRALGREIPRDMAQVITEFAWRFRQGEI